MPIDKAGRWRDTERKPQNALTPGEKFGAWTVVCRMPDTRTDKQRSSTAWYKFRCVCGAEKIERRFRRNALSKTCVHANKVDRSVLQLLSRDEKWKIRNLYAEHGITVDQLVAASRHSDMPLTRDDVLAVLDQAPSMLVLLPATPRFKTRAEANAEVAARPYEPLVDPIGGEEAEDPSEELMRALDVTLGG